MSFNRRILLWIKYWNTYVEYEVYSMKIFIHLIKYNKNDIVMIIILLVKYFNQNKIIAQIKK